MTETKQPAQTYEEIADEFDLDRATRFRFLTYMRTRWPDPEDEKKKCISRYAAEWAIRFQKGVEYMCSDTFGKSVLNRINRSAP